MKGKEELRLERALRASAILAAILVVGVLPSCLRIATPVIQEVTPLEGQPGTEVTIRGNHFTEQFSRTGVIFNGVRVPSSAFVSATNTELHVLVPSNATTGDLVVRIGNEVSQKVPFTVIGPYALVLNEGSNDATVIDTHTQIVKATVPAGEGPFVAAFTPDKELAYVLNRGGAPGSVTVLQAPDLGLSATIPVGADPSAVLISFDSTKAYVANRGAGTVSAIDTGASAVFQGIAVGAGPATLALDPTGASLYVSNETEGSVSVIDVATDTLTTTLSLDPSSKPGRILIRDDGKFIYVLARAANCVYVLSKDGPAIVSQVFLDPGLDPVDMVKSTTRIYIAEKNGQVSVLRTDENTIEDTVNVGGTLEGIASLFSLDGNFVYVLDTAASQIVEIDASDRTVSNRFGAGSQPVALRGVVTALGSFLYVPNQTDPGTVTIFKVRDFEAPIVVPVGRRPVDVAFQP